jgi:hypothetical protein
MNFNVNYEEIDNYTVKPGKYEAVVKSTTINENKNGKQRIQIVLTIRNDVEQAGKNKCYFYDIYKALDPSPNDNAIGGFIFNFVMKIAQACSIPANSTFESLDDLLKALVGKPVLMTVGEEEWNGKTYEKVTNVEQTKNTDCRHVWKTQQTAQPAQTFVSQPQSFASQPQPQTSVAGAMLPDMPDFSELMDDADVPF